ncbi:MAG TPA: hypothetical protein VGV38_13855 [Pyrinomonadaceae bacterium]|nr:hypothetical protein [Pyrinomonadaceae bacterium]
MAARKKPVVIVEDQEAQREGLIETLARYEFSPVAGETISQTLELLRSYKDDAAVVIIDMDMSKFPDYDEQVRGQGSEITGTGLAKRVLRETKLRRPEVIIYSIHHDRAEYYKQAIEAGASVYSNKSNDSDRRKFLSVIHALALKHSFQPNQPNDAEMAGLAEGHANTFELLEYFYRNKLSQELGPCLASTPHLLLIRDKTGEAEGAAANLTSVYSDAEGVPGPGEFDYAELHRRVFNQRKLDQSARYSIYSPEADLFAGGAADRLKEFVFIELVNVAEVEMTLGIVSPFPPRDVLGVYPLSTQTMAEALLEHATPALETFVQQLLFRWREKQSVKVESVKTSVGLSGNVQRRLGPLVRDQRLNAAAEAAQPVRDLRQLSDDLSEYNRTLSALLEGRRPAAAAAAGGRVARLSDVVQEIKTDYDRLGHFDAMLFKVSADCVAPAERYYFSQALRALVAWAFQRRAKVAGGGKLDVQIGCTLEGRWLEVNFQENSVRLSKRLRESYLFEPLSLLRVAQMIVEVACHGRLVDATDELPGETGHLFKIRLLRN